MTVKVCFDMTPALGNRTGIGNVVEQLYKSIGQYTEIELYPYTISYKAVKFKDQLPKNNTFINIPASLLIKFWKKSEYFNFDRKFSNADIWHATNYLSPPTNKKSLITIHDVTLLKYPHLVSKQTRDIAPIISKRLQKGAHVHVPTEAIKIDVLEHFSSELSDEDRIHVIPFSVPPLIESQPTKPIERLVKGDPFILSIGALEPRKNHPRLIQSFETIHAKHPNLRLFLVGPDGPARPKIDEAMANLSHSARSKVTITGPVNTSDRTYLLRMAHIIAYPSLYEGFGLPLLEAMSTQTPIVTTKEGSLAEVGGLGAQYVDAHSSEDIARGIIDVLESDDLRKKLIEEGKKQAKKFSWEKSASMMVEVYKIIAQ